MGLDEIQSLAGDGEDYAWELALVFQDESLFRRLSGAQVVEAVE